jgi:hypothetical protein
MSIAGVSAVSAASYLQQPQATSQAGTQTPTAATTKASTTDQAAAAQQSDQVHHHHHHGGGGAPAQPANLTQSGTDAATGLLNALF